MTTPQATNQAAPGSEAPAPSTGEPLETARLDRPRHSAPGGDISVNEGQLCRRGEPFRMSGVNYWSALPVACQDDGAGLAQVTQELDTLQGLGVNAVRIMAGTEGPNDEPWRIVPTLQSAPGVYDPRAVFALERVVEEIEAREMVAIVCLSNFWPWSGGFAQYVSWATGTKIPYPFEHEGDSWDDFTAYSAQFYENEEARNAYWAFVRFLVPKLSARGSLIWELANEPRGMQNEAAYVEWIGKTAQLIKELSPAQLVTVGSEGETADPRGAGLDLLRDHASEHIDLVTCHVWAQNWGWLDPNNMQGEFAGAVELAKAYVKRHAELSERLGKPLVLEEFGFPRDHASLDPNSTTVFRDRYFLALYEYCASLRQGEGIAGVMPWAWAGYAKPNRPGRAWRPGEAFTGDPPHEPAGWYSIYAADETAELIRRMSAMLQRRPG